MDAQLVEMLLICYENSSSQCCENAIHFRVPRFLRTSPCPRGIYPCNLNLLCQPMEAQLVEMLLICHENSSSQCCENAIHFRVPRFLRTSPCPRGIYLCNLNLLCQPMDAQLVEMLLICYENSSSQCCENAIHFRVPRFLRTSPCPRGIYPCNLNLLCQPMEAQLVEMLLICHENSSSQCCENAIHFPVPRFLRTSPCPRGIYLCNLNLLCQPMDAQLVEMLLICHENSSSQCCENAIHFRDPRFLRTSPCPRGIYLCNLNLLCQPMDAQLVEMLLICHENSSSQCCENAIHFRDPRFLRTSPCPRGIYPCNLNLLCQPMEAQLVEMLLICHENSSSQCCENAIHFRDPRFLRTSPCPRRHYPCNLNLLGQPMEAQLVEMLFICHENSSSQFCENAIHFRDPRFLRTSPCPRGIYLCNLNLLCQPMDAQLVEMLLICHDNSSSQFCENAIHFRDPRFLRTSPCPRGIYPCNLNLLCQPMEAQLVEMLLICHENSSSQFCENAIHFRDPRF